METARRNKRRGSREGESVCAPDGCKGSADCPSGSVMRFDPPFPPMCLVCQKKMIGHGWWPTGHGWRPTGRPCSERLRDCILFAQGILLFRNALRAGQLQLC